MITKQQANEHVEDLHLAVGSLLADRKNHELMREALEALRKICNGYFDLVEEKIAGKKPEEPKEENIPAAPGKD